jgi:hypothetical protein
VKVLSRVDDPFTFGDGINSSILSAETAHRGDASATAVSHVVSAYILDLPCADVHLHMLAL